MLIKTLIENTSINNDLVCEHGLSLYLKLNDFDLLFDVGMSNSFLLNAEKLSVDIKDVDYLFISHGHYDHGGGLKAFIDVNKKAKIYLNELAFSERYSMKSVNEYRNIGIDKSYENSDRIIKTNKYYRINAKLETFVNNVYCASLPSLNKGLFKKVDIIIENDDFIDEQNLIISDNDKSYLLTGCAHNGIINIVESYKELKGVYPDYLIGGFHLSSKSLGDESEKEIKAIGEYLLSKGINCYTAHCTGLNPYRILKEIMGSKLSYLATGSEIEI